MQETRRILITVKTYPNPSAKYQETVCVAGIDEDGRWVRIYPVPFRQLREDQQFRKFDIIEASVTKARSDPRPESYNIDRDSIRIVQQPKRPAWETRRDLLLADVAVSVEQLKRERESNGRSLGVIQPRITDFTTVPTEAKDWTSEELRKLDQEVGSLFDELEGLRPRRLQKIPYTFHYHFTDDEPGCAGHSLSVHDWEVYQYARRRPLGDHEQVAAQMRARFLDWVQDGRDVYFVMGTMMAHPQNWIVVGLFYPPIQNQMRLNFGDDTVDD